jgi:hypothetical protein
MRGNQALGLLQSGFEGNEGGLARRRSGKTPTLFSADISDLVCGMRTAGAAAGLDAHKVLTNGAGGALPARTKSRKRKRET